MWNISLDLAQALWHLLPELTTALRFGTALIGFGIATSTVAHRLRRRQHSRQP